MSAVTTTEMLERQTGPFRVEWIADTGQPNQLPFDRLEEAEAKADEINQRQPSAHARVASEHGGSRY